MAAMGWQRACTDTSVHLQNHGALERFHGNTRNPQAPRVRHNAARWNTYNIIWRAMPVVVHTCDDVMLHHTFLGTQRPPPPYTRGNGTTSVVIDMAARPQQTAPGEPWAERRGSSATTPSPHISILRESRCSRHHNGSAHRKPDKAYANTREDGAVASITTTFQPTGRHETSRWVAGYSTGVVCT